MSVEVLYFQREPTQLRQLVEGGYVLMDEVFLKRNQESC